jgi:tRNA threonylcarbamoyladenosine biosynthesis protein TsaE
MDRDLRSGSRAETAAIGRELARELFAATARPAFVSLKGELGAGKTELARAFIAEWLALSNDPPPPATMPSPTFNIAIVYGQRCKVAHLDFYRLRDIEELEQLGLQHYFHEHDCVVVEWLDRIPEAAANAIEVELEITGDPSDSPRMIKVRDLKTAS